MRKVHSTIAAIAAVTITLAACEQQVTEDTGAAEEEVAATETEDAEAQIEDLGTRYEESWSARDWDAILAMHTEDYQEFTPEGVMTYQDVEAAMRDTAQAPPEDAELTIEFETVEVSDSGDLAYATGTTSVTATGPDGETMTERSRWMGGFERAGDEWKIDRLVISPMSDGEAAPAMEEESPAGGDAEGGDMEDAGAEDTGTTM